VLVTTAHAFTDLHNLEQCRLHVLRLVEGEEIPEQ